MITSISLENLTIHTKKGKQSQVLVKDVSISVPQGTILGIVGESGSGKSLTVKSMMGIAPKEVQVAYDRLELEGRPLSDYEHLPMAMIFQDPMTALNPVKRVGDQIAEAVLLHNDLTRVKAKERACEMLEMVGIPAQRYDEYPHQFSGGMKQRVVIAMALACNPSLLLADEPTTALDVTIQAQVLEMISDLKRKLNTSMIMITHDLGIVAEVCDEVCIVYGGQIVEYGTKEEIFDHPLHPYTIGLFGAIPNLTSDVERLTPIPGLPADPTRIPAGCRFAPRCDRACEECKASVPLREIRPGHFARCCMVK